MGRRDDPSTGEAEPDADCCQPYPAASWAARTTRPRRWFGPQGDQARFFDQPLAKVALELETGSR
jgi:hypothetical protein